MAHFSRSPSKNGGFSRIDYSEVHLIYILLNKVKINWRHYIFSRMFTIKKCNKGTSFIYVSMILKILKFFNICLFNLSYKSPRSTQEFSQRTLTNLGYVWNVQRMTYYLHASKNSKRIYYFDDPTAFEGEDEEEKCVHMVDEKHIGDNQNPPEGDAMMHDASVGDDHATGYDANSADTTSIITMLQNMQVQQDESYTDECRRRIAFQAAQIEQYNLMQQHLSNKDSNIEAFASYVTEALVSLRTDMNVNNEAILARINTLFLYIRTTLIIMKVSTG